MLNYGISAGSVSTRGTWSVGSRVFSLVAALCVGHCPPRSLLRQRSQPPRRAAVGRSGHEQHHAAAGGMIIGNWVRFRRRMSTTTQRPRLCWSVRDAGAIGSGHLVIPRHVLDEGKLRHKRVAFRSPAARFPRPDPLRRHRPPLSERLAPSDLSTSPFDRRHPIADGFSGRHTCAGGGRLGTRHLPQQVSIAAADELARIEPLSRDPTSRMTRRVRRIC